MTKEFSKTKAALTRSANKIAAGQGVNLRGKVDFFGSFASYRIDDPQGVVTMKQATALHFPISRLLTEAGFAVESSSGHPSYHMNGVVFTWSRK